MRDPEQLYFHDRILGPVLDRIIPHAVVPNHLTVARFCLIPVVFWLLFIENYVYGIPLFLLAALSDVFDGTLARIRKQVTQWGMRYDPLADKLLIGSTVIAIILHHVDFWLGAVLIALDLFAIIAGFWRVLHGEMIMANHYGKAKMFFQVLGITFLLVGLAAGVDFFVPLSAATLGLAVIFAVISMLTYGI